MHQENTARAVILSNGFMLALKPSDKAIFFTPGGRVEPPESTRAALAREMAEELPGVAFEVLAELGLIEHRWREPSGHDMIGRHHFFHVGAPVLTSERVPVSVEHGFTFEWLPIAGLGSLPIKPPSLARLVPQLASGQAYVWSATDLDA
jgi:8-oxo-dGTP pyrophosphatase MutT (NUDIX family)